MKARRSWITWLLLLPALLLAGWVGGRWVLTQYYPLDYPETLYRRSAEHGLDPYLVAALIRAESKFRPGATSPQGARGLMQIMPETGKWVADQMGLPFHPDDLYDPDYNMQLGCWYLAHLLADFGQDPVLALAAYNGGRSNVMRWLTDQHWTGEHQTLDQIPFPETRHYVKIVLRDYRWYRWLYGGGR